MSSDPFQQIGAQSADAIIDAFSRIQNTMLNLVNPLKTFETTLNVMKKSVEVVVKPLQTMRDIAGSKAFTSIQTVFAAKLPNSFSKLMDISKKTSDIFGKLSKPLDNFKDVFKRMGDSKTGKAMKAFGGTIKKLTMGAMKEWALEKIMGLLETLMGLLEPFNVIFEIINGMLGAFVGGVLSEIMPALQPIFDLMIQTIPAFAQFGSEVGKILAQFIGAFIPIFQRLSPLINLVGQTIGKIFVSALNTLMPILMKLAPFIEIALVGSLVILQGVLTGLELIFRGIGWVVDKLVMPVLKVVEIVFWGVAYAIAKVINFISDTIQKIPILKDAIPDFGVGVPTIPSLANGGIATSPMFAKIGDAGPSRKGAEMVIPLNEFYEIQNELISVMEDIERNTRNTPEMRLKL